MYASLCCFFFVRNQIQKSHSVCVAFTSKLYGSLVRESPVVNRSCTKRMPFFIHFKLQRNKYYNHLVNFFYAQKIYSIQICERKYLIKKKIFQQNVQLLVIKCPSTFMLRIEFANDILKIFYHQNYNTSAGIFATINSSR